MIITNTLVRWIHSELISRTTLTTEATRWIQAITYAVIEKTRRTFWLAAFINICTHQHHRQSLAYIIIISMHNHQQQQYYKLFSFIFVFIDKTNWLSKLMLVTFQQMSHLKTHLTVFKQSMLNMTEIVELKFVCSVTSVNRLILLLTENWFRNSYMTTSKVIKVTALQYSNETCFLSQHKIRSVSFHFGNGTRQRVLLGDKLTNGCLKNNINWLLIWTSLDIDMFGLWYPIIFCWFLFNHWPKHYLLRDPSRRAPHALHPVCPSCVNM